jgi:hypothetical protein
VRDGWVLEIILNDFKVGKSITRAIGRSGPWIYRLYINSYCSARDWDGKDYLRIIPRVVW